MKKNILTFILFFSGISTNAQQLLEVLKPSNILYCDRNSFEQSISMKNIHTGKIITVTCGSFSHDDSISVNTFHWYKKIFYATWEVGFHIETFFEGINKEGKNQLYDYWESDVNPSGTTPIADEEYILL